MKAEGKRKTKLHLQSDEDKGLGSPGEAHFPKGGRRDAKAKHLDGSFLERNCREEAMTKVSWRPCVDRAQKSEEAGEGGEL